MNGQGQKKEEYGGSRREDTCMDERKGRGWAGKRNRIWIEKGERVHMASHGLRN